MATSRPKGEMFRRSIKKVLIVYRPKSSAALTLAREVSSWLKSRGIRAYSIKGQKISSAVATVKDREIRKLDLALVLGGDGTYLEAVRVLQDAPVPLLGVNMGSLGFLTVVRVEDIYHALELTLSGRMQIRERRLAQAQVLRDGKVRDTWTALNDVVIERGSASQLLNMAIYIDRQLSSPVKADGLIVATPTGSTAYNLAAGGPILHPNVHALVVTPICAHSLTNRPLIVPDGDELLFRLVDKNQRAHLTIDGRKVSEITGQDEVIVRRAAHVHLLLRKSTDHYFNLLREKLKFGERA